MRSDTTMAITNVVQALLLLLSLSVAVIDGYNLRRYAREAPEQSKVVCGTNHTISHCEKCDNPELECDDCLVGYIRSNDRKACIYCPSDCAHDGCVETTASGSTDYKAECRKCKKGWTRQKDGTCGRCAMHCDSCELSGVGACDVDGCKSDGLSTGVVYFNTSGSMGSCPQCPQNCLQCSLPTKCDSGKCAEKTVYVAKRSTCEACGDHCSKCSAPGKCDSGECDVRYYLDSSSVCRPCGSHCKSCKDADRCEICDIGYERVTDTYECQECPANCMKCHWHLVNKKMVCDECKDKYQKTENPVCSRCPDNCDKCDFDKDKGTFECKTDGCIPGHAHNKEDGTCDECPDNCDKCEYRDGSLKCLQCENTYTKSDNDKKCSQCPEHCIMCKDDDGKPYCYTCEDGYTVKGTDGSCSQCAAGCKSCLYKSNGVLVCSDCDDHYILTDDKTSCLSCPPKCKKCVDYKTKQGVRDLRCIDSGCDEGYYYNSNQQSCRACNDNKCKYCNDTVCFRCKDGYVFDNDKTCTECDTYCVTGQCSYDNVNDKVICSQCSPKDYDGLVVLADGTCEKCSKCASGCSWSSSNNRAECAVCKTGWVPDDDKKCIGCPPECDVCEFEDEAKCTEMICSSDYFYAEEGQCVAFPPRCTELNDDLECTVCGDGFKISGKDCIPCPALCKRCDLEDSKTTCTECTEGWRLDSDATCQKCQVTGCTKCNDDIDECDPGYCVVVGYKQYGSTCTQCKVDGCKHCSKDANACDLGDCHSGYKQDVRKCYACEVSGCNKCDTKIDECDECDEGYKQDGSTCKECKVDGCKTCDTSTDICSACYDGFYKSGTGTDISCTKCKVDGCKTCTGSADECSACYDGFFLSTGTDICTKCEVDGCKQCAGSADECSECYTDYYESGTGTDKSCTKCNDDGCKTCTSSNKCTLCKEGYKGDGDVGDKSCTKCKVTGCKKCDNDINECDDTQCKNGYRQGFSKCTECKVTGCKTCDNDIDECDEGGCDEGYRYLDGDCTKCKITGCKTCNDNINECQDCFDEYGEYSDDKTCIPCPQNCKTCTVDSSGKATCDAVGCKTDHIKVSQTKCYKCPYSECTACDLDGNLVPTCSKCNEKFTVAIGSTSCFRCVDDCKECSHAYDSTKSETICNTCDDKYALTSENACEECPEGCQNCTYILDISLTRCDPGRCKDKTYQDVNGKRYECYDCPDHCQKCTLDDSGKTACDQSGCGDGYYFNNITKQCWDCSLKSPNCRYCSETGLCWEQQCEAGYGIDVQDEQKKCQSCGEGCQECKINGQEKECKECIKGGESAWVLKTNGKCMSCGTNCESCEMDGDAVKCKTCKGLFTLNSNSACVACPRNCLSCSYDSTQGKTNCDQCESKYGKDEKGDCKDCAPNCDKCNTHGAGYCDSNECQQNYTYVADEKACKGCGRNCKQCTTNGESKCDPSYCYDHYTYYQQACHACPDNCKRCTMNSARNAVECDSNGCEDGYGIKQSDKTCSPCPYKCSMCTESKEGEMECSSDGCYEGYQINVGDCAACPKRCLECRMSYGSVECTTCQNKTVLKDGECKECPLHCQACHESGDHRCDAGQCEPGRGVSLAGQCEECSVLTFEYCKSCTDVDPASGNAKCNLCEDEYTLKDDGSGCTSCLSLECNRGTCIDRPYICGKCTTGYEKTRDESVCGIQCYECEEPKDKCNLPPIPGNTTTSVCEVGEPGVGCWMELREKDGETTRYRGCLRGNSNNTCTERYKDKEDCTILGNGEKLCRMCCINDKCNTGILRGKGNSARIVASFLLLVIMAFIAIVM